MKEKVVFILESMVFGGVEKSLIELLKAFDYDKFDVTVLLRNDGGEMQSLLDSRVRIKYWDDTSTKEQLKRHISRIQISNILKDLWYRLICRVFVNTWQINGWFASKCLPLMDDEQYDWAIAYHGTTPSVTAGTLYRVNSVHKALWIHAYVFCPDKYQGWFDKEYDKFDRIYCVSETMQKEFAKMFPTAGKKTSIFHNILNKKEILIKAEATIEQELEPISLVTVGRLSTEKGQDVIPEVIFKLRNMGYPVNWYIVGDGYLREKIDARVQQYGVEKWVTLVGNKINPYPYIKSCDIYVQTSVLEGWCLTTHEARILCKPVVTTGIPVMYEQFQNGVTGIIAESTTADALVKSIKYLLDNPQIAEQITHNLQKQAHTEQDELNLLFAYLSGETNE